MKKTITDSTGSAARVSRAAPLVPVGAADAGEPTSRLVGGDIYEH